jgi:hypothetical protein
MAFFKGTVVVVAISLRLDIGNKGLEVWNSFRRALPGPAVALGSSVSTVTNSFWGARSSPTSSSNICFLGEVPRVENRLDRWLLRGTRRVDEGRTTLVSMVSLSGSGDDMMSALGVAMLATECQRTWKASDSRPDFLRRGIDEQW